MSDPDLQPPPDDAVVAPPPVEVVEPVAEPPVPPFEPPPVEEPWVPEPEPLLDAPPDVVPDTPPPAVDPPPADVGPAVEEIDLGTGVVTPSEAPPTPIEPPPLDVGPPPVVEAPPGAETPVAVDGPAPGVVPDSPPPSPPAPPFELYEDGGLVAQVPISDDLVTVDEIRGSEAYQRWVRDAAGGLAPAASAFDSVTAVGDAGDSGFWFQQNAENSCGPSSATQIINDFLGAGHLNESAVAQRALDLGLYDPAKGMTPQALEQLLDDQGVPSTVQWDQDFGDVEQYLREGRAVVMFLDNKDITSNQGFAATDEVENSFEDTVNHFVRVIGIDRARGVAVLADPGQADAAQLEVPLDTLLEAWNDVTHGDGARRQMLIVSDQADANPDAVAVQPATSLPEPVETPVVETPVEPPVEVLDPDVALEPSQVPVPQSEPIAGDPSTMPPVTSPGAPDPVDGVVLPAAEAPGATDGVSTSAGAPATPAASTSPGPGNPPAASGEVTLGDPGRGRSVVPAAPRAQRPVEIELPVDDPAVVPPGPDGDVAEPGVERASGDGGLFDPSLGWVILPVAFAAGRVSSALRRS